MHLRYNFTAILMLSFFTIASVTAMQVEHDEEEQELPTSFYNKDLVIFPMKEIRCFSDLVHLALFGNKLTELPPEISELVHLERLFLSYNQLKELPCAIGDLKALTHLSLSHNQLSHIPKEIGKLIKLDFLTLSYNHIQDLPIEICLLVCLEELGLSDNQLKALPKEFRKLIKLQYLMLRNNPGTEAMIKSLPRTLEHLKSYTYDVDLGCYR